MTSIIRRIDEYRTSYNIGAKKRNEQCLWMRSFTAVTAVDIVYSACKGDYSAVCYSFTQGCIPSVQLEGRTQDVP